MVLHIQGETCILTNSQWAVLRLWLQQPVTVPVPLYIYLLLWDTHIYKQIAVKMWIVRGTAGFLVSSYVSSLYWFILFTYLLIYLVYLMMKKTSTVFVVRRHGPTGDNGNFLGRRDYWNWKCRHHHKNLIYVVTMMRHHTVHSFARCRLVLFLTCDRCASWLSVGLECSGTALTTSVMCWSAFTGYDECLPESVVFKCYTPHSLVTTFGRSPE